MRISFFNIVLVVCILGTMSSCTRKIINRNAANVSVVSFDTIKVVTIHEGFFSTGPCEPSISINPGNVQQMVAGSVLDNVYTSEDGGFSWHKSKLKSSFGVYGDPVIRYTNEGNVLYTHLSNSKGKAYNSTEFLDRIVVQSSTDNGKSWSDGSFPPSDHIKDHDKQWLAVSPVNGDILLSWTEFDKYGSKSQKDKSRILFSHSQDNGRTWSEAIKISDLEGDCLDDDNTTEGAHPAIGTDGTYYIVWGYNGAIYLDLSKDGGKSWLSKDIKVADQIGGWSYEIPGIDRCNGMPVLKCDHSTSPYRGNLYISWTDQKNGVDNTDVWFISSSDGGNNWSAPVKVNNDSSGKHQFFSWMDIDQTTGYIYLVFYDRRNYEDNQTDVFLAYSTDGGKSFENMKISETSFLPEPIVFFGDYNDISAHEGKIRPIWTRQDNTKLSIQTAIIDVKK